MGGHVTLTLKSIPWAPCLTGYTYPYVLVFGPPLRTPVSNNPLFTCFIIIQTIQIDFWWQLKNLPPSKIIYQGDKTSNEVVKFSRPFGSDQTVCRQITVSVSISPLYSPWSHLSGKLSIKSRSKHFRSHLQTWLINRSYSLQLSN